MKFVLVLVLVLVLPYGTALATAKEWANGSLKLSMFSGDEYFLCLATAKEWANGSLKLSMFSGERVLSLNNKE